MSPVSGGFGVGLGGPRGRRDTVGHRNQMKRVPTAGTGAATEAGSPASPT